MSHNVGLVKLIQIRRTNNEMIYYIWHPLWWVTNLRQISTFINTKNEENPLNCVTLKNSQTYAFTKTVRFICVPKWQDQGLSHDL